MKYFLFIIVLLGLINANADEIYQYTNSKGQTVFTNKPPKSGAKKVELPPLNIYAAPMSKSDIQAKNYIADNVSMVEKNKSNKNSINWGTNEKGRNKILAEELTSETQALKNAQQTLEDGKKIKLSNETNNIQAYNDRIKALQDAVTEHQKNIEILNKQLTQ